MRRTIKLATASVILAVFTLGAVGCARDKATPAEEEEQAFADVRAKILTVIADPERAANAVAVVTAVEKSFFETRRNMEARKERFRQLNADYNATRADIEAELDRIMSDVKANQKMVTDAHRQLVDLMTADEWAAVQKAQSKALSAAIKHLQSI